jgi:hypothetical protein
MKSKLILAILAGNSVILASAAFVIICEGTKMVTNPSFFWGAGCLAGVASAFVALTIIHQK